MPPLVSILIVNHNGEAFLEDCLRSVSEVVEPENEVVVVDNASNDASRQILARFANIKIALSDRNLGFAGGNNLGLRHCSGDLILLLNSDTIVTKEFLSILTAYLDRHPCAGVVQGKMVLPRAGGVLDVCGSFLTPLGVPYHRGYFKPDGPAYQASYPVFCGKGACLLLRRQAIEAAGGFLFDDDFFCYYEESDFCFRVWLGGMEVHFVAGPPIQHLMGATAGKMGLSCFALRLYLKNQTFTLASNLSAVSVLKIFPLYFAVLMGSLGAHALRRQWGQAGAHVSALMVPLTEWHRIAARRRLIGRMRKVSDEVLWPTIGRWPGWRYFWMTFQGRLSQYKDPEIKEALHESG